MKVLSRVLCSITFLGFFLPFSVHPQVISSELKTKVAQSDMIITGKVIEQKSVWNSDKSGIYTFVTIRVDDLLKGAEYQSEIIVKHPGGEVGNVGEVYSHIPTFRNDEEVLVFLKKSSLDGSMRVFGGDEGKYSFFEDKLTKEKLTSGNIRKSELQKEIRRFVKQ